MKHNYQRFWLTTVFALLLHVFAFAQSTVTVSGTVKDKATGEELPAVSISVKGKNTGTSTDSKGHFSFKTSTPVPFVLTVSSIGFKPIEVNVTGNTSNLVIELTTEAVLGQEVVVAASRVEEKILESPVSIERIGVKAMQSNPAPSFYDAIANLKGADVVTSSLTFKTITTRGFGGSGNTRVNQLVDGMDNQAPGLNFSVGNVIGLTELDAENVEILPGASSALYGAGGMNGTILMTGKDPFKYTGLSFQTKQGLMHVGDPAQGKSLYSEYALRYAQQFNNKLAFKVNASYLKADDWQANDTRNYNRGTDKVIDGNRASDPNYDGVNVYGDEISANIKQIAGLMEQAGAIPAGSSAFVPNQNVSRTGYDESSLVDYGTYNVKLGGELQYKLNETLTLVGSGRWGKGTTVYTGSDRYSLSNFNIGQYKLELKGSDFYVRAYTTQEDAGESYNGTVLAQLMNESWKPSFNPANAAGSWYPQYVGAYLTAYQTIYAQALGQGVPADQAAAMASAQAHSPARQFADQGRLVPGTDGFNTAKNTVASIPIPRGALFTDKSDLYQAEGLYNLSKFTSKVVDLQVGGNYRMYSLNSKGTLFVDTLGKAIDVKEYGAFAQVSKRFLDDKIKLSGSLRYDKNENFKGQFSPRVSAVWTFIPENSFRASYQTGFRNPTNQDQYINLNTGSSLLIGGLPQFQTAYNFGNNPGYTSESVVAYRKSFGDTYAAELKKGTPSNQAAQIAISTAAPLLQKYSFKEFNPEKVESFEFGYKGLINKKLLVDLFYYASSYKNFIGMITLVQPKPTSSTPSDMQAYAALVDPRTSQNYSTYVNNTSATVKTQGWGAGFDYLMPDNFVLSSNVSYNDIKNETAGFRDQFNTPKYRFNAGFSNNDLFKGLGFGLNYRYQSEFLYDGSFGAGTVPSVGTFDAQLSYKILPIKTMIKMGGSNIGNKYYQNAFGNPGVGGLYYVSLTFDQLLK
ncbi:TonB-dependent receptor [Solitalea sp. MAHUQ-68]|uniref:TonB-dependent receptor n=1 Tax=Solitalea agri TaxID=2953739 RepID=A0A9X2JFY4_9SPHI|nr:TonB-dependent receptor [Solitalea agri]MCO4293891.1 TonB-dependent receptor [Solitalea agri]